MRIDHEGMLDILIEAYEAQVPVDIKGPMGIGKSETVFLAGTTIAEKYSRKPVSWNEMSNKEKLECLKDEVIEKYFVVADIRLTGYDQTDLKGFPVTGAGYSMWEVPLLIKVLSNPLAKGIIFADEMNLAERGVIASMYQLIDNNQINDVKLSSGVLRVSAGNRLCDTNNASPDPQPLNNRRLNYELRPPTLEEWTKWAYAHDIDDRIIGYLNWKSMEPYSVDPNSSDPCQMTPRMLARLSKLIKGKTDEGKLRRAIGGSIGEGYGAEMMAYLKLVQKISVKEILENPEKWKKFDKQLDMKFAIASGVVTLFKDNNNVLDKVITLVGYMEKDMGMFLLRNCKMLYSGSNFGGQLVKCKSWKTVAPDFAKYLID